MEYTREQAIAAVIASGYLDDLVALFKSLDAWPSNSRFDLALQIAQSGREIGGMQVAELRQLIEQAAP
jgi:GTP cyclohydrolase III